VAKEAVAAKDGWIRIEKTRLQAHRREWKFGQRDYEPEHADFSLDKLERRLQAQVHAGGMPSKTCRRPSVAARGNKLLNQKVKQSAKEKRITAVCKAMRATASA
jgi:hypothetical protein